MECEIDIKRWEEGDESPQLGVAGTLERMGMLAHGGSSAGGSNSSNAAAAADALAVLGSLGSFDAFFHSRASGRRRSSAAASAHHHLHHRMNLAGSSCGSGGGTVHASTGQRGARYSSDAGSPWSTARRATGSAVASASGDPGSFVAYMAAVRSRRGGSSGAGHHPTERAAAADPSRFQPYGSASEPLDCSGESALQRLNVSARRVAGQHTPAAAHACEQQHLCCCCRAGRDTHGVACVAAPMSAEGRAMGDGSAVLSAANTPTSVQRRTQSYTERQAEEPQPLRGSVEVGGAHLLDPGTARSIVSSDSHARPDQRPAAGEGGARRGGEMGRWQQQQQQQQQEGFEDGTGAPVATRMVAHEASPLPTLQQQQRLLQQQQPPQQQGSWVSSGDDTASTRTTHPVPSRAWAKAAAAGSGFGGRAAVPAPDRDVFVAGYVGAQGPMVPATASAVGPTEVGQGSGPATVQSVPVVAAAPSGSPRAGPPAAATAGSPRAPPSSSAGRHGSVPSRASHGASRAQSLGSAGGSAWSLPSSGAVLLQAAAVPHSAFSYQGVCATRECAQPAVLPAAGDGQVAMQQQVEPQEEVYQYEAERVEQHEIQPQPAAMPSPQQRQEQQQQLQQQIRQQQQVTQQQQHQGSLAGGKSAEAPRPRAAQPVPSQRRRSHQGGALLSPPSSNSASAAASRGPSLHNGAIPQWDVAVQSGMRRQQSQQQQQQQQQQQSPSAYPPAAARDVLQNPSEASSYEEHRQELRQRLRRFVRQRQGSTMQRVLLAWWHQTLESQQQRAVEGSADGWEPSHHPAAASSGARSGASRGASAGGIVGEGMVLTGHIRLRKTVGGSPSRGGALQQQQQPRRAVSSPGGHSVSASPQRKPPVPRQRLRTASGAGARSGGGGPPSPLQKALLQVHDAVGQMEATVATGGLVPAAGFGADTGSSSGGEADGITAWAGAANGMFDGPREDAPSPVARRGGDARPVSAASRGSPDKHELRGRLHAMQQRMQLLETKLLRATALGDTACAEDAACRCEGRAGGCSTCLRGGAHAPCRAGCTAWAGSRRSALVEDMRKELSRLEGEMRGMRGALGAAFVRSSGGGGRDC